MVILWKRKENWRIYCRPSQRKRPDPGGAGTGLLVSCLYSPDTVCRRAVALMGLAMILVGWYLRSRFDKQAMGED